MRNPISLLRDIPGPLLALILIEGTLKATASWKAFRNGQRVWAVLLIVLNSGGILPLLYLFHFQQKR